MFLIPFPYSVLRTSNGNSNRQWKRISLSVVHVLGAVRIGTRSVATSGMTNSFPRAVRPFKENTLVRAETGLEWPVSALVSLRNCSSFHSSLRSSFQSSGKCKRNKTAHFVSSRRKKWRASHEIGHSQWFDCDFVKYSSCWPLVFDQSATGPKEALVQLM